MRDTSLRVRLPFAGIDPKKGCIAVAWQGFERRPMLIKVPTLPPALLILARWLEQDGVDHVYYESPYVLRNVKVYADLHHTLKLVEYAFSRTQIKFTTCAPTEWQGPMLCASGEKGTVLKGGESKRRSKTVASQYIGEPVDDDDLADAMCIMLYANLLNTDKDLLYSTFGSVQSLQNED